jgi:hypothetical protein
MEVEGHEEALMDVVVFRKARPTAPEVLLAITIIPHFYLIRDASARLLAKDSFSHFTAIHKFGKIHQQALDLMTLPQGNAEKRENARRSSGSGRSRRGRSSRTLRSTSHLGFVLTTKWTARAALRWSIRWSTGGGKGLVLIFATTRATSTSWRRRRSMV